MHLSGSSRLSDLAALFLAHFEQQVGPLRLEGPNWGPQQMVDGDMALLARAMNKDIEGVFWRGWQNRHCLVVPRHWSRLASFARAVMDCPLPVALRTSGGSAVAHGPHILNLSMVWLAAAGGPAGIEEGYRRLAAPIIAALGALGLTAGTAHVPGAHCDGSFNLVLGGRKLAGTAGLIRPAGERRGLLLHASLALAPDARDLPAIIALERALGRPADYRADAHTSLSGVLR
jgi:octanoyl-[GcvH]:protein N-octanoyltransferase